MKYLGAPRWRYLTFFPLLVPFGFLVAILVTGVSFGCVRGMRAWFDAMGWAMYDD